MTSTVKNAEINPEILSFGEPVYARVCEHIRQDILSGKLEAGIRLKIHGLCQRYNVSQMPIREALQQLQGEGLIVIEPNRGAYVRRVDEHFIKNMYDIRGAIDALLARLGIPNLTDESLEKILEIQERYEEFAHAKDTNVFLTINKQFHHEFYMLADNPEALQIMERQWGLIDTLRAKYGFGSTRLIEIMSEHRELLEAYEHRNIALAERIARDHCEKAKIDLLQQIRDKKGFDKKEDRP